MSEAPETGAPPAAPKAATSPKDGPNALDFVLVIGAMLMVGGGLVGLFLGDQKQTLPIIASILSFLCGSILGGYAGYRWGASDALKKLSPAPTAS